MNMEYRGYRGSSEYDGLQYFGQLLNVKDLVTFEGRTRPEFEQAFRDAVDDYIDMRSALKSAASA